LGAIEARATRLCSHTHSVGLNPKTSMARALAVVGAVGASDESATESSCFHVHRSRLYVSLASSFPFALLWPTLLTCSCRASVTATQTSLFYSATYLNSGGLELCFGGRGESKPERRSGKRIIAGTAFRSEFLVGWCYDADATMAVPELY